jgi:cytochrome c-type biogenesis protein CcmH
VIRRILVIALIALMAAPALAVALTVRDVAREVRCPTCNTPLDESSAPVALDMKAYIAQRIDAGWSKQRIIDGLVGEFGSQVLATPPKSGFDLIAWIVPAVAVALGLCAIPVITRTWARRAPPAPAVTAMTDEERRRLDEKLGPPI